jgi:hypothetical protein
MPPPQGSFRKLHSEAYQHVVSFLSKEGCKQVDLSANGWHGVGRSEAPIRQDVAMQRSRVLMPELGLVAQIAGAGLIFDEFKVSLALHTL